MTLVQVHELVCFGLTCMCAMDLGAVVARAVTTLSPICLAMYSPSPVAATGLLLLDFPLNDAAASPVDVRQIKRTHRCIITPYVHMHHNRILSGHLRVHCGNECHKLDCIARRYNEACSRSAYLWSVPVAQT